VGFERRLLETKNVPLAASLLVWDFFPDNKENRYLIISANGRLDSNHYLSLSLCLSFPSIDIFQSSQEGSKSRNYGPAFEEAEDVSHPQACRCLDRRVEAWSCSQPLRPRSSSPPSS
jgi:hypothetical protein